MSRGRYFRWIIYFWFSLFFIYQVLTSTDFIMKYIALLLSMLEISMLIFEIGIYNYHKGNLVWLDL